MAHTYRSLSSQGVHRRLLEHQKMNDPIYARFMNFKGSRRVKKKASQHTRKSAYLDDPITARASY